MELQRPRKPSTKKIVKERDEDVSSDSPTEVESNAKKTKNNFEKIEKMEPIPQQPSVVPTDVMMEQPKIVEPIELHSERKGGIFELLKEQPTPMESVELHMYPKLELPLPSSPPLEVSKLQIAYLDPRTHAAESLRLPVDLKEKLTSVTIELVEFAVGKFFSNENRNLRLILHFIN